MFRIVFFLDLLAHRKRIHKIILDLRDGPASVHPGSAFKMQVQTAEIQIGSAYGTDNIIAAKTLGMDEGFVIFINL